MIIQKPKISAVIITNDNLECVNAVKSVDYSCFEIIIVNTVKTRKVNEALRQNPKVRMFYFKWIDDFSKARNYGIRKATGDWILTIDSDEILKSKIDWVDDKYLAYLTNQVSSNKPYETARLFQNNKGIFYRYKVHETIDYCLTPENSCGSQIVIEHNGYDITPEEMQRKLARNYKILENDKENVIYNYHMGSLNYAKGEYEKAITFYQDALKDRLNDPHYACIYNCIYACRFMLKQPLEILLKMLRRSLFFEPFQIYARANIVEHLFSVIAEQDSDTQEIYYYTIRKELEKLRNIFENKLSALMFNELEMTEEWLIQKETQLTEWLPKKNVI